MIKSGLVDLMMIIDPRRSGQISLCLFSTSPDDPGIAGGFLLGNLSGYLRQDVEAA